MKIEIENALIWHLKAGVYFYEIDKPPAFKPLGLYISVL